MEIIVGVATAASGVLTVVGGSGADHIPAALVGVALVAAGITIVWYAIQALSLVQEFMKFYTTFLGRGITFVLVGIIGFRSFSVRYPMPPKLPAKQEQPAAQASRNYHLLIVESVEDRDDMLIHICYSWSQACCGLCHRAMFQHAMNKLRPDP